MIDANQDISIEDFINSSELDATPANDNGRVAKLETQNGVPRQINREFVKSLVRFGGTGADGALSISSGTTTVDLGGARVYVLNYSSISITGTGKLAFSNPHANGTIIVIKCAGACTMTASAPCIDVSNCGAAGGAGGQRSTVSGGTSGSDGNDGQSYGFIKNNKGLGATSAGGSSVGGAVGSATFGFFGGVVADLLQIVAKYPKLFIGAGGGGGYAQYSSGGSGNVIGGDGGRGGGCLIMEIAGSMNFTTANGIKVGGSDVSVGSHTGTPSNYCAGGGGGGGGGSAFIFYNHLTAFSGTVNISGGVGGNNEGSVAASSVGGGGGGSANDAGDNGSSTTNGLKGGGDGGNGIAINALNTEFA